MYRFLAIIFWTGLIFLYPLFQFVKPSTSDQNFHPGDTALFNQYLKKAMFYSNQNSDSMHYYGKKALNLAHSTRYAPGLAEYYHFLTAHYNEHSHYDSAMKTAQKELYWAYQSKDEVRLSWSYNAIANVYEYLGNIDSSVAYFIKALEILPEEKNKKLYGTLNYNLASSLYMIGDFNTALNYAKKGYSIGKSTGDIHLISNSLLDMGSIHVGLKHYDSALQYFEEVIRLVKDTPDSLSVLDALNNEGDLFAKEKQYARSLSKYKKMLHMALRDKDSYYLLYAHGNMGITLFQLKQYDQAENHLKKAIALSLKTNSRNELRQFYSAISDVKEAQKKFASALTYRKQFDSLNNLLMSESSKQNMHQLEVKYQTLQKDKRITQQNLSLAQKQQAIERKNRWIMLFIGGLTALLIIFFLAIRSYSHKKKLQEQSILTLKKQHEVNTLHAKMEAREEERNRIGQEMHDDIGSALTSILYLSDDLKTKINKSHGPVVKRISDLSGKTVNKMNEIIWSMNRQYDTLDDLIAYTRQHAAEFLENYEIAYHFEVPDPVLDVHLQGEQRRNIYLVVKEALHNIVKHAQASDVRIIFQIDNGLTVTIHDNGKGFHPDKNNRFGNGLRNMQQRMEALGGSFEIRADKGTKITVRCNLNADAG